MKTLISRVVLPSVLTIVAISEAHAQAQVGPVSAGTELTDADAEDIIVLGSRRRDRTIADSPVAIDVIEPEAVTTTGYTDVNDALRTLVPAFNAQRLPLNDGSSFVRPITLRASPADHVLLLLNKKRRHRSAIVQIGKDVTLGFRDVPNGKILQTETFSGPWSTLRALKAPNIKSVTRDASGTKWLVEYTVTSDKKAYSLWYNLEFNTPLPDLKEWPVPPGRH